MPKRYDGLLITKNEICGCQVREVYFFLMDLFGCHKKNFVILWVFLHCVKRRLKNRLTIF